jgi:hypothetical protein
MYRVIMPCPDNTTADEGFARLLDQAQRAAAAHAPITGEAPLTSVLHDVYARHADPKRAAEIGTYGPFTGLVFDFPTADTADR